MRSQKYGLCTQLPAAPIQKDNSLVPVMKVGRGGAGGSVTKRKVGAALSESEEEGVIETHRRCRVPSLAE